MGAVKTIIETVGIAILIASIVYFLLSPVRAGILISPDGRTASPAEPERVFKVGDYVFHCSSMEPPAQIYLCAWSHISNYQ